MEDTPLFGRIRAGSGAEQTDDITLGLRRGFVQELLGHADISLTLNVDSHILPDTWVMPPPGLWMRH